MSHTRVSVRHRSRAGDVAEPIARVLAAGAALLVFCAVTVFVGVAPAVSLTLIMALAVLVLRRPIDGLTGAGLLVVVLLLWPSGLRVSGLGAAGAPVVIQGSLALAVWTLALLRGSRAARELPRRLQVVLGLVAASVLLSYVAACLRPDLDLLELKAADRGLVTMLSCIGLSVAMASLGRSGERMDQLVRLLVLAGAGAALLGAVEFFTAFNPLVGLQLPGFELQTSDWDNGRSGFTRVFATTAHPIEYSVVMAMVLPLALHRAFSAPADKRIGAWLCVGLIAAVLPMTVSRTAVLGLAAVGLVLFPGWSPRRRVQMLVAAFLGAVAMRLAVPGLIGTIRSLFTAADEDPSVSARTEDYEYAASFIYQHPILGRGFGTFVPGRYTFLDNEFLMTAVTGGLLGLVALLLLYLVPLGMLWKVSHEAVQPHRRDLARALLAGLTASFVTSATYDAMSFSTARGLAFVFIGLAGSLWVLHRRETTGVRPPWSGIGSSADDRR